MNKGGCYKQKEKMQAQRPNFKLNIQRPTSKPKAKRAEEDLFFTFFFFLCKCLDL